MDINLNEIVDVIGARVMGDVTKDEVVHEVSTDTRALDKADLFVALVGKQFNGHDFIKQARRKNDLLVSSHLSLSEHHDG